MSLGFQFSGGCEYVLAQTKYNAAEMDKAFAVWVKNKGCGFYDTAQCQRSLSIKFWNGPGYKYVLYHD